jgi:hypothetical protein
MLCSACVEVRLFTEGIKMIIPTMLFWGGGRGMIRRDPVFCVIGDHILNLSTLTNCIFCETSLLCSTYLLRMISCGEIIGTMICTFTIGIRKQHSGHESIEVFAKRVFRGYFLQKCMVSEQHIHVACWISKATCTYVHAHAHMPGYPHAHMCMHEHTDQQVILPAFPWQQ